jgi:hypothetical protein
MISLQLTKLKKPHVKTIPTKYLKAIIAADGLNHDGTKDYGPILPELIDELNRRAEIEDTKHFHELLKQANDTTNTTTKVCTQCKLEVAIEDAKTHFYTKLSKYRPECKKCSKDKIYKARKLKKIDCPF